MLKKTSSFLIAFLPDAFIYLVMPVLMAQVLDLPERAELALVILAICAGAPLLPKKLIKFGGSHPSDRTTLAIACSSRHIGI